VLADGEGLGDVGELGLGDTEGFTEGLGVGLTVGLTEGLTLGLGEGEGSGLGDGVGVGEGENCKEIVSLLPGKIKFLINSPEENRTNMKSTIKKRVTLFLGSFI